MATTTTATPAGVSRARSLLRDVVRVPDVRISSAWRLWQRDASIYRRTYKLNIIPNFFEPFLYLLAMGLGLGAYLSKIQGYRYLDFIAPGLVATASMYGASFEVTFNCFVKMQFGKIYDAVMATPLTIEDIGLGELMWSTTRSLIYGCVFLVIVTAFGVVHSWLAVLTPVAVAMTGLMFSVIGLSFTAVIPLIDFYTYYWTMFITPMFLFSGIFPARPVAARGPGGGMVRPPPPVREPHAIADPHRRPRLGARVGAVDRRRHGGAVRPPVEPAAPQIGQVA